MNGVLISVRGDPAPKGSARSFLVKGRIHTTNRTPKLDAWTAAIQKEAREVVAIKNNFDTDWSVYNLPVNVDITFRLPGCSYQSPHTIKPDLDKLIRAVLDALTGIIWADDSQVVSIYTRKQYGCPAGCSIIIREDA